MVKVANKPLFYVEANDQVWKMYDLPGFWGDALMFYVKEGMLMLADIDRQGGMAYPFEDKEEPVEIGDGEERPSYEMSIWQCAKEAAEKLHAEYYWQIGKNEVWLMENNPQSLLPDKMLHLKTLEEM